MNFDDIKKAMDDEPNDLNIPLSVKDIKSSHSAMKKIKKHLIMELTVSAIILIYIVFRPLIMELHSSAQVLYNLTAFNAIMAFLGFLLFQLKLIRGLGINNLTSKQSIEKFMIKIKSAIEAGKYIGTGLLTAALLPIIIGTVGNVVFPESYTYKYLYLNIPMWQIIFIVLGFLLCSLLTYIFTIKAYKKLYYKELLSLEKIINQF